eukprot:CAMPEP_0113954028 /NCGR_PEP_ID=MMETSP0011_2-20120614/205_1 /TAXON_ID=101924 /ORGANISM="Rhodosorus marinus" /LENGTH=350 /DNA_ID=CAMNT_0000962871 /DNA_START=162 /DNA_END=1214 /DNA_ORIENTATION=+ /assembly_acc=CAM_ASM_000156
MIGFLVQSYLKCSSWQPRKVQKTTLGMLKAGPPGVKSISILASVPVAWSTYNVAVRLLYSIDHPPPAPLINVGNYLTSLATFQIALLVRFALSKFSGSWQASESESSPEYESMISYYYAGFELGLYLFLGSTIQLEALKLTTASKAAFIVQTTSVLVPTIEAILGRFPFKKILPSVVLASIGIILFSVDDPKSLGALDPSQLNLGDSLALFAAVFYSLHVIRLGSLSSKLRDTFRLARAKTICQLCIASVYATLALTSTDGIGEYLDNVTFNDLQASALILVWLGAVTTAYPQWAQTRGQMSVPPSVASILYSTQPVWSSITAFVVLSEQLPLKDIIAGVAIISASLLAI